VSGHIGKGEMRRHVGISQRQRRAPIAILGKLQAGGNAVRDGHIDRGRSIVALQIERA
jgi:hypothetical protein